MANNPWRTQYGDTCEKCLKWCVPGTLMWSHDRKWNCIECSKKMDIICLCKKKKNPGYTMCVPCQKAMGEEAQYEYEKELKEIENDLEKKKLEEELKKKEEKKEKEFTEEITTTCLSIGCQERRSVCCDSYSAETPSGLFVCRRCGEEFKSKPCNAKSKVPLNVAFDVDDVLWKIREDRKGQCPDYELISVLKWFVNNGDNVYVWSAGGVDYAKQIVWKLGLDHLVTVIPKGKLNEKHPDNPPLDLSFDDCEVNLARVDINVRRPDYSKEAKKAYDDINEGLKKIGY